MFNGILRTLKKKIKFIVFITYVFQESQQYYPHISMISLMRDETSLRGVTSKAQVELLQLQSTINQ